MHEGLEAFKECGWASFVCLLIGGVGLATGFVSVLLATRARNVAAIVGMVAMALGLASLGAGILGRQRGLAVSEAAASTLNVDASQKERIRAQGEIEASQCVKVGGASGALPFVLGTLAAAVGFAARKKAESPT